MVNQAKAPSYKQYKDFELYSWTDEDAGKTDTVYKKEWYTKILLKKKTPISNFDEKNYHGHGGSEDHIENQVTYNHSIKKEFYEFRLIEIDSESSVKEHFSFVHCI